MSLTGAMKSQSTVHCWELLAGYSAYGGLNIFDTRDSPYKSTLDMKLR